MSDIKLFRIAPQGVAELAGASATIERSLQLLIEKNLEAFLAVRLLASEYRTGKTHGGRIDTLGLDENGSPVISEYKRALNENVINQGLFYLDWLMDHQAELELLVLKKLGQAAADEIDWSTPRLVCIAGDFTKYDEHAVQQINRNIELIRYKRFSDDLVLLELVNARTAEPIETTTSDGNKAVGKTFAERLSEANPEVHDRLRAYARSCRPLATTYSSNSRSTIWRSSGLETSRASRSTPMRQKSPCS
jgi:hypothetical protein